MSQFWNLVKLFTTPSVTPALFGGGMFGYVMYDVTHYYLHHAHPTRAVTKNLKVKQSQVIKQDFTNRSAIESLFFF